MILGLLWLKKLSQFFRGLSVFCIISPGYVFDEIESMLYYYRMIWIMCFGADKPAYICGLIKIMNAWKISSSRWLFEYMAVEDGVSLCRISGILVDGTLDFERYRHYFRYKCSN